MAMNAPTPDPDDTESGPDVAGTLQWLEALRGQHLPEVEQRARWLLLDTLGCIAAGLTAEVPDTLATRLSLHQPGPVRWPGQRAGLAPLAAIPVGAMAACWHEACEGLARAHGRPGLHAVPVAAALGSGLGASLGEVLDAVIWGYEIGGRAGELMRIRQGLHVDGSWGLLAATAAAGRLRKLSHAHMMDALASAACQVPASLYAPVRAGKTARNTYVAHAAVQGVLLAEAAGAGITAPISAFVEAALQIGDGSMPAGGWPWAGPNEWLILQGYLKPYAAVRHAHYVARAAQDWHSQRTAEPRAITGLVIETYPEAITYCGIRGAEVPIQAQFSLSYAAACVLLTGDLQASAYDPEVMAHPELRRLEQLVELRPGWTGSRRGAVLHVQTAEGTQSFRVDRVPGDADLPFDETMVRDKAQRFLRRALAPPEADALVNQVLQAPLSTPFMMAPGRVA